MEQLTYNYGKRYGLPAGTGNLIYYASGTGKKSIVLMHGYHFNSQTWENAGLVKALNKAGYKTFLIDVPNFPESVNKFWATPKDTVLILDAFIDDIVKGNPAILGSSASGFLWGEYLVQHRDKVGDVVFCAPVNLEELDLKNVDNRMLIILGSRDSRNSYIKEGIKQLKKAKVVTMDGGHVPYMDHPEEFCRLVIDFLGGK